MTTSEATTKDYLGMSDDDFLNINAPEVVASDETEAPAAKTPEELVAEAETAATAVVVVAEPETDEEKAAADEAAKATEAAAQAVEDAKTPEQKSADELTAAKEADKTKGTKDGGKVDAAVELDANGKPKIAAAAVVDPKDPKVVAAAEAAKVAEKPVDYEAFFKQVMAPFKANGREIKLNTPEEALRLMQMGAGYGRKIQDLQPALKTLKMLEKANLLDEGKLSFLIDINNKNPDAIKKLIKESGIDPLDLNIGDNAEYTPKSHSVSDKEMAFHQALGDVQSNPSGNETLRVINQTWDAESKALLLESPQVLGVIQSQRENGVYSQIVAEIDRQKMFGRITPTTPFLQAYKLAGDHLQATNGFKTIQVPIQTLSGDTPQPQVIATRTAAPKAQVQNGDKAAAAASTKTTPARKSGALVNPLEMADDEFLKQFKDRL